jgi:inosine-uridine nucleoside N-ribohydrolase
MVLIRKIPVILDTDIGDDIDDTWALGLLLLQSNLDILLITTVAEYPRYDRTRLVTQFLARMNRDTIPVVPGIVNQRGTSNQSGWIDRWDIPINTETTAPTAIVETVRKSSIPVTVITIGPLTNLHWALSIDPTIAGKVDWVAMAGSYRECEPHTNQILSEYNIAKDIPSAQVVFQAPWRSARLAPLDVCNQVYLPRHKYQLVKNLATEPAYSIIGNYLTWLPRVDPDYPTHPGDPDTSTILYDTVAVYIANQAPGEVDPESWLTWETVPLVVTDSGTTIPHPNGNPILVATGWSDVGKFTDYLVQSYRNISRFTPIAETSHV